MDAAFHKRGCELISNKWNLFEMSFALSIDNGDLEHMCT